MFSYVTFGPVNYYLVVEIDGLVTGSSVERLSFELQRFKTRGHCSAQFLQVNRQRIG